MKKLYSLLAFVITITTFAQAPQGFNYQATVRNSAGELIIKSNVYFKFNVIQGSQTAVPVFTETHYVPTDDLGQVNLVIGQGSANTGAFSQLDWSLGSYYLGIELSINGANNYVAMGTTQLLSVPYAFYAQNSGNATSTTPNLQSVLAENNSAGQQQIKNLLDPTDGSDAVTKSYADALSNTQGLMNFNGWDKYQISNDNSNFQLTPNSFVFLDANNTTLIFPDGSENGFGDVIYIYLAGESGDYAENHVLQPSGFPIRIPKYDLPSYDNYYGFFDGGLNTIINVGDYWMVGGFQGQIITDSDIDNDGDGFTENQGDCDDNNASINPGANEIEDGIDNNCDGEIDEGFNESGTVTDQDGNTYDYLPFGDQLWTVQNAEMVTYRDGTPIPQVTDNYDWESLTTGAWSYYGNDPTKPRLYNWFAVMGIHDTASLLDASLRKEFAPEGWHVPSFDEWITLENYLIANGYNFDQTTTGNKIAKAMASTTGWDTMTLYGTVGNDQSLNNSSGFNIFPEGSRGYIGDFRFEGDLGLFWSSTDLGGNNARNLTLYTNERAFTHNSNGHYIYKQVGNSVRFVRD